MTHTFTSKYGNGDVVYLRVADEPARGMVTAVQFAVNGGVLTRVSWSNRTETWHYEAELSTEYVPDFAREAESKA